ncbi:hypothetical protein [uncultured Psychroserpens sp.]|uniref:hypothetical protein n=1 Tax=uncultured Psychroserpens sp. TaxID=255436 RepID=UPI00260E7E03|nr:hypothetical protein [uncultured Psychroserpens sp.]
MKFKYLNVIVISIILLSCNEIKPQDHESDVLSCLRHSLKSQNIISPFSYLKTLETSLIKEDILKNNTKEGYMNLVALLANQKENCNEIITLAEDKEYDYVYMNHTLFNEIYKNCIYKELGQNKKSKQLNKLLDLFDKMQSKSFKDESILKDLIHMTNFKNDNSRLMICHWIYTYCWVISSD